MNADKFLGPLTLLSGAHERGQGMCAMEAAAYLAHEPHSDKPECVSPVIGAFMRSWNDSLPDADRQKLKPWIVKCLHTNTGAQDDETRAWLATDWLVRECTPAAARAAARAAVWAAAWAAAGDAAWAAAGAATAWDAARAAARAAARDAARAAAGAATAWDAVAPTVARLQASAFGLLERMIAVGQPIERALSGVHTPEHETVA